MRTCSGAMSSTRLIRRKPSSQSISATLNGLPSMGYRRGVDRSEPFTDAPFQPITASEGTKHARVKEGGSRLGAELIGQFTAREMIEIGLERGVQVARHACQYSQRLQPKRFCSAVATERSTVVCYSHASATTIVQRDQARK